MPRVKRGTHRRASRKKTLELASGYFLTKSKLYRAAQEAVERGLKFAYVGRKNKKRDYRALWIVRINAACREAGISYSKFVHGLKAAGLVQITAADPACFAYRPVSSGLDTAVGRLEREYAERPILIIQLMSANAIERLRTAALHTFADAFVLKKKDKDRG